MHEHRARTAQESLDPRRRVSRVVARGERHLDAHRRRLRLARVRVQQQPPRAPRHQPMHIGLAKLAKLRVPSLTELIPRQRAQRRRHRIKPVPKRLRCIIIKRSARRHKPRADPREEPRHNRLHQRGVRPPHIPIPQHLPQRWQRIHQPANARSNRRQRLDPRNQRLHSAGQVRQHHMIEQRRELGQLRRVLPLVEHARRRRVRNGVAPPRCLNDRHRELRLPLQLPDLMKGARPLLLITRQLSPPNTKDREPVQQPTARQIGLFALIKIKHLLIGRDLHPQRLLLRNQIALQRHARRVLWNLAQPAPHDQLPLDHPHRQRVAVTQDRERRFRELLQPRNRPPANRRERLRQPDALNHARGRRIKIFLAHEACHLREPLRRDLLVMHPQMLVPARADNACAISRASRQSVIRPRDPRRRRLSLRQPLQQRIVRLRRVRSASLDHLRLQHRRVPRPADHHDACKPLLHRRPDRPAHMRLARRLLRILRRSPNRCPR